MADHAWTQDHIAAFVAGGLPADEAARLAAHARDCPECGPALKAARRVDGRLTTLFAAARPGPALEDRMILALRTAGVRRRILTGRWGTVAAGVAATVGLGAVGAVSARFAGDGLPLPGAARLGGWAAAPQAGRETAAGAPMRAYDIEERQDGTRRIGMLAQAPKSAAVSRDRLPELLSQQATERGAVKSPEPSLPAEAMFGRSAPPPGPGYAGRGGASGGEAGPWELGLRADVPRKQADDSAFYFKPADAVPRPGMALGDRPAEPTEAKARGRSSEADKSVEHGEAEDLRKKGKLSAGDEFFVARGPGQQPPSPDPKPAAGDPQAPAAGRKVIRSGEIEFEVDSFDAAVAAATRLVNAIPGAFVATVNSDKLPNGKVRGTVAVRVPPDALDGLVLDLRRDVGKLGELKGQRIGSQDVTKQFTDLESRLRAARTMEQRLLQVIKEGKGEIKQLLEAEKELGNWRTRIEEIEGELRYLGNLASLSTLVIGLAEKEIRAAAGLTESERVQAGVEVEDVDAAYRQALAAVADAKGRVTKSELKQLAAGQFNATLQFEVAPDAAGPVRDRLRQLGRVARLEIDRVQRADGGPPQKDAKVTRGDAVFAVQLYNLANVAPRETAALTLAVPDVPAGYQALRDAVGRASGRVVAAQLNEQDRQNVSAQLDFEVRRADEGAVLAALAGAGEVVSRQVTRAPEGDNVTDSKVLYRTALVAATRLRPRETATLAVEVQDVDAAAAVVRAQAAEANARPVDSQVALDRAGKATARLVFDVPLAAAPGLVEKVKAAGTVRVQQSARDPQAPDGRFATARVDVTLSNADLIVPRDDGVWAQVRKGLAFSASVLLMSVTWVVFGLCVVLPWAVVGYGGYRLARRLTRPRPEPVGPPPAAG